MARLHGSAPADSSHLPSSDTRPRMAKADLRKSDMPWRAEIGHAIQRAAALCGWSLKELASAVNRDPRQCARWIDGTERPQMDVLFAVEKLRQPFVVALAEIAGEGVEIETIVRVRTRRVA